MQPEDIDQLFRDRLADHAPTPPAFVWDAIEAEIQPRKRRPAMWLAAAAVALFTLLGGAWWVLTGGTGSSAGRPEMAATTTRPASATPARPTPAPAELNSEKNTLAQATPSPASPSSPTEAPATAPAAVVATTTPASEARSAGVQPDPAPASRRISRPRASEPQQLAVAASLPGAEPRITAQSFAESAISRPELPLAQPTEPPARTVAFTGPIEVEVRNATEAPAPVVPAHRPRLVSLLRQARNVVQGEKVSLTAAGLPETVTVQARLAGRTLTKVIQL
ncbi:hypothetical protein [Hymenobacter swuensis]|uniref:Uncharacterized protein n=1 Tax=Hymenobacter swuensis DY53 TaxID=1227739 RepID=W8F831_9BACT|nr:hypothetical protein [Hymenobacter swuensis]AHJ97880.1 hypothetical protein Hsw_2285 [Hymenobacter swuensis DY53]